MTRGGSRLLHAAEGGGIAEPGRLSWRDKDHEIRPEGARSARDSFAVCEVARTGIWQSERTEAGFRASRLAGRATDQARGRAEARGGDAAAVRSSGRATLRRA